MAARPPDHRADPEPLYDERLAVPWWAWPAGFLLGGVLAAPVHGGAGGARAVVPYVVAALAVVAVLLASSRGRIVVADGVLHVPGARAPVDVLGAVQPLGAEQTRRLRGPSADLRAHVATRPWLRRAVLVGIEDPDDDTPYWLVGSTHPEQLAAALEQARFTAGGRAPRS
jgi:hypothetical protein